MNLREERNFLDLPYVTMIKDLRSGGAIATASSNSLDMIGGKEQQQRYNSSDGGGIDAYEVEWRKSEVRVKI